MLRPSNSEDCVLGEARLLSYRWSLQVSILRTTWLVERGLEHQLPFPPSVSLQYLMQDCPHLAHLQHNTSTVCIITSTTSLALLADRDLRM